MAKVDFWRLPRSVQERFVACTVGAAAPAPLAVQLLSSPKRALVHAALGLVALLATLLALRVGFGDLDSRYALAPSLFLALYAAGFALAALGFLKAAIDWIDAHAVPYRPALYLFPVGVIDARTPTLVVHRISETSNASVDRARSCLRVEIDGSNFEFPALDLAAAERASETLLALRKRLAEAGPESSARERALVDPLLDNGFKNPFSPPESLRKVLPRWLKVWPLLAFIFGVLLGGVAFLVRNHLSEARLYSAARMRDRTEAYRLYLARGGKNPDVEKLLLPRAELRDATLQGNVSAIERFISQHPTSPIKPEADAALERALLAELKNAEAQGSLSALKTFAAKYSSYAFLAPSIERAFDARIETTLAELKPALAPNSGRLLDFIRRLLRYTEKHGPNAALRFQRKPTETLQSAEQALIKNAYFSGDSCLPGQYFDDAHAAPRESAVAAQIGSEFQRHFPVDLLNLQRGPELSANDEAKALVPTLRISYHTEMSGAFTSRKPRFAMSGIGLIGKASFEIPGDPEALVFKLTVWRAPDLKTVTDTTTPAELYEAMANEAFKRFTKKYLASWFAEH